MTTTTHTPSSIAEEPTFFADAATQRVHATVNLGPVLLATDGMGSSDAALIAARQLAERLGVSLQVVTVLERLPMYPSIDPSFPLLVDSAQREAREAIVRRRVSDVVGASVEWSLVVRYGSTSREIAEAARAASASVIVLGSAPHRHMRRTIAGRRAIQVLQRVGCPVLSVYPEWTGSFKLAVVAVDFSPASVRAAQAALSLLGEGGQLMLVHVQSPLEPDQPARGRDLDAGLATMFVRLRDELRPLTPPGVTVETRCLTGQVVESILRLADTLDADLIAVGTHGVGIRERLFVGSVAMDVIHSAECTVLASPEPSGAEAVRLALRMAGTIASVTQGNWAGMLDAFTRRNAERAVTIEVDDPATGAQVQVHDYRFTGASYDRHDGRVTLMLRDPGGGLGHVTRTIARPDVVSLYAGRDARDHALEIKHGTGHTLLLFADRTRGPVTTQPLG